MIGIGSSSNIEGFSANNFQLILSLLFFNKSIVKNTMAANTPISY